MLYEYNGIDFIHLASLGVVKSSCIQLSSHSSSDLMWFIRRLSKLIVVTVLTAVLSILETRSVSSLEMNPVTQKLLKLSEPQSSSSADVALNMACASTRGGFPSSNKVVNL